MIYSLSIPKVLIADNMARNVLLVAAGTYTKYIPLDDKSTRMILGDGAAALFSAG